ncbi:MAG: FtsX-like permease family protein [Chloroflexi bacterium]|nr:FtsX-like permease family protein [Chloroflexota bacterium]
MLADGRLLEQEFEAVLGATAAAQLGLGLGQTFLSSHGVELGFEPDEHDDPFTVVGILQPTGTPYDAAVFTTVESIWLVHDEHDGEEAVDEHGHEEDGTAVSDQVTAVLVKPINPSVATSIWQEFYVGTEAQAAFPGQELGGLFDQLRQAERVLTAVGYLAAVMAGLTIFLALYSATIAQEQGFAVMRSLGANRSAILQMVLWEALLVAVLGGVLGRVVGYSTAALIAENIAAQSAVPVLVRFQLSLEPFLWLLPLALAAVGGLYPALLAYRVNVIEKLFPS